ncbi:MULTISPECIES: glycosyltransferase family 4 protein [unclassified Microbacterium]|uniref:glycosyltransferase family 4 protein n=1 Tax=unclassified Microbacterium TaxID=2609290 RepID=UPI000EA959D0|nr:MULTISPECIES: glycosyltransferase family 4 protein [unclassified Microbacterium]MBT2485400.1 glycosyltransferase family 4 protein [Microbacterium sp. ISL-108]RKN68203.1 glycosyltransferase [Microbacterium sp. CGR2]
MRILVVTPWFPTTNAPVSGVFVRREVEALSAVHDVTVLHLDWQRGVPLAAEAHPGHDYRHESLGRTDPRAYHRARRAVADAARDHDVVHTHALTVLLPWPFGRPGGDRPWVHSEHWSGISAPETLGLGERGALAVLGRRLSAPDAVVAESTRLATAMRRFRRTGTDVVPCVVDTPDAMEPRRPDGIHLVGVGGIIPRKGPLLAVAAVAELVSRGLDTTLTWVGEGPLSAQMLSEANDRGISERVRLTGALDDAGVARELNDANMFILPTQGDNFCVVAAEALVHGRPVVSGAATGAVDYAEPSVSRFVTVQTGVAYADAIQDLANATVGVGSSEIAATVAHRFTSTTVAAALTTIYDRVR